MLKADLHLHTSEDIAEKSIKYDVFELIDHTSSLGFDVIALTAHSCFLDLPDARKHAEDKGILLMSGIECDIDERHVVVLNAEKGAERVKTFPDLRKYREDYPDIFVLAPHPYYPKGHCLRGKLLPNIDLFDGIEYCHFYFSRVNFFNKKAVRVAKQHDKALVGTSDAHSLHQIDYTYTLIDAEKNVPSIIRSLKDKRIKLVTRPLPYRRMFSRLVWAAFSRRPRVPSVLNHE